jgi:hypothetical protein
MGAIQWSRKQSDMVWTGRVGQIIKGAFHATSAGYGFKLTTGRTWIERGNADDGGAILTGSGAAYLFGSRRLLVTAAQTGNNSWYGGCDRLSVYADLSGVTAHIAGHWGFLESKGSATKAAVISVGAAVRGQVDLSTQTTITNVVSCFMGASNNMGGTHTGPAVIIHATNPVTGTYDGFAYFGISGNDATGCISAGATKSTPGTVDKYVIIYIAGTAHYIPAYTSKTA